MARNIKVKIAETEYSILAGDDMMERNLRLAADAINNMLSKSASRFPDKGQLEKLAFVALNQAVSRLKMQDRLAAASEEIGALTGETSAYLDRVKQ